VLSKIAKTAGTKLFKISRLFTQILHKSNVYSFKLNDSSSVPQVPVRLKVNYSVFALLFKK